MEKVCRGDIEINFVIRKLSHLYEYSRHPKPSQRFKSMDLDLSTYLY